MISPITRAGPNKFGSAHMSLNTQVEFYSRDVLLVLTKCNKTNID